MRDERSIRRTLPKLRSDGIDSEDGSDDPVAALCVNCGLCCNGVLFSNVKLQAADSHDPLIAAGISLKRRGSSCGFSQPCAAFDGQHCHIYQNRPRHCRAFECRILQRVQAGEMSIKLALRKIQQARRWTSEVEVMLSQLGRSDDKSSLVQRYRQVMREPLDLGGDAKMFRLRTRLFRRFAQLTVLLDEEFRT